MKNISYKKHFPNLNSTRFIAFIPVFLTHCFYTKDASIQDNFIFKFIQTHLELGLLGLDYFFVLSSFLISWIIYEENANTQKFNMLNFYVRRALRIFPLYFLIVFIGFGIVWIMNTYVKGYIQPLPPFYNFGLFILNFYMIDNGFNFLFFLTFFWSVSVEEQFYIGWALMSKYFLKYAHWVAIFLIVISLLFRVTHLNNNNQLVFHTLSSLGNFGVGCLLSYFFTKYNGSYNWINGMKKGLKLSIYLFGFLLMIFYPNIFSSSIAIVFERFVFALLFVFVITDLAFSQKPTFNLDKYTWMDYFGQLSFGLYCYHGVTMTFFIKLSEYLQFTSNTLFVIIILPTLAFTSTLFLAHISYQYFEKPILKMKQKFI